MKIYEIRDSVQDISIGTLIYYERARAYIVELEEKLDQWNSPLLFANYVRNGVYTMPREVSAMWVSERVIPSGRQNIQSILQRHKMKEYDEMRLLELSEGRCSQDDLYIRKMDELPKYVKKRNAHNLVDVVFEDDYTIVCLFVDGVVKKLLMKDVVAGVKTINKKAGSRLYDAERLKQVLMSENLYKSGEMFVGGYGITFNNTIDVPAYLLYSINKEQQIVAADFEEYIKKNILDTGSVTEVLQCTRQNLSYATKQGYINPIKENVKGNLFRRGNIIKELW